VLAATANRIAELQRQQTLSNQQIQLNRARQQLSDDSFNWSVGQAAIALGDNPSKYMSKSSSGWGGGGAPAQDPRIQIFASVHQVLLQASSLRGSPDPQVPPAIATRASDILNGRTDLKSAIKLVVEALPPGQRTMVKVLSSVPFVGQAVLGPVVRASAAGAVPLDDLYRLVPDALLPGQPSPTQEHPGGAVVTGPAIVRSLFTSALATSGENSDAAFIAAIDAAERTPTIDDDIYVLQELSRVSGNQPPSEPVLRRAEALVSSMAERTERRDDVAHLLAWIARVVVARGLATELSQRVLKSAQAVLLRPPGDEAAVTLTAATCEVFVAIGKADRAVALVDVIPHGRALPIPARRARSGLDVALRRAVGAAR